VLEWLGVTPDSFVRTDDKDEKTAGATQRA